MSEGPEKTRPDPYRFETRRDFLKQSAELGILLAGSSLIPGFSEALAQSRKVESQTGAVTDIVVRQLPFAVDGRTGTAVTLNGGVPGPLIRLREGAQAVVRVKNELDEITSIHWHGILLPPEMDGVPGVSFAGIKPKETFTYRFPVKQSGTYWYHSHSGGQELLGMYGPLIIAPLEKEPFSYERDYVIVLSDWSFTSPMTLLGKLKSDPGYYNFQKRDLGDLASDVSKTGFFGALSNRLEWSAMRMDPTDLADVTGYTYSYLMNGLSPQALWTGTFKKKERVRLRFIAAGAMTLFDVRIPGLTMRVVQADGQNVKPVTVDEFRIAPGETYDVIVEPTEDKPYAIFAETLDRSGYAMGALAPRPGMRPPVPERRKRPVRGMEDMGMSMAGMKGMKMRMAGMNEGMNGVPGMSHETKEEKAHGGHDMAGMKMPRASEKWPRDTSPIPGSVPVKHGPDRHGSGNSFVPEESRSRLGEPGIGLGDSGRRILLYTDLKSLTPSDDRREPLREIEFHLTGNMNRYMWSIDGKKYSESPSPIVFHYGERLRLTFVNDTMMEHPMHLHGMWMYLENGNGDYRPKKHTVMVKSAERLSVLVTADAPGRWAFHCHLLLHMEMGMFRVVEVKENAAGGKS